MSVQDQILITINKLSVQPADISINAFKNARAQRKDLKAISMILKIWSSDLDGRKGRDYFAKNRTAIANRSPAAIRIREELVGHIESALEDYPPLNQMEQTRDLQLSANTFIKVVKSGSVPHIKALSSFYSWRKFLQLFHKPKVAYIMDPGKNGYFIEGSDVMDGCLNRFIETKMFWHTLARDADYNGKNTALMKVLPVISRAILNIKTKKEARN
jgi:hypothetical protein